MKNLVKLLTGIACITAILIAGACCSNDGDKQQTGEDKTMTFTESECPGEVTIFVSSFEIINDTMHLKLFDSHGNIAIDSLETDVVPGGKVIWRIDPFSEIEKFIHIKGEKDGKVFKNKILEDSNDKPGKSLTLELDCDIKDEEKYEISFQVKKDKKIYTIDPILRVPPGDGEVTDQDGNGQI